MNLRLTYVWLHLPTNVQGELQTEQFYCIADLLRAINAWNMQQPQVWKYWWKP